MAEIDRSDIVIIGAGVVGCALFRRFALMGLKPLLVEAGGDILSGASKGNSALLHTGFDALPDSLELTCMQAGYREYLEIREHLNLPLVESSALVVAWDDEQLTKLPEIVAKAHRNGVGDVREIGRDNLRRREPHLADTARGAVLVPGEHIIDPWSAPLAYVHQGLAHGGRIHRRCRVTGGDFNGDHWRLETTNGEMAAGLVINAAGNYGDIVEAICRTSPFKITPRKGQFVVFDKPAAALAHAIILPVPTERTKGIVISRTAFGNLLVGPTAEDQEDRALAEVDQAMLQHLIAKGTEMLPALAQQTVNAVYAGLRPATQFKDYQIDFLPERHWITVGGIRSTGLTAALGIAQHVAALYQQRFDGTTTTRPIWTPVPNLCEYRERPYQTPAGGDILCHCEWVTRQEVEQALAGPFPAGDLGGLKRRTRCMMGRCQGFYCGAEASRLADERWSANNAQAAS
ncbi:NAD(P)/FAD-dependent oxidoreductase [Dongia soli]|uniref:NAD(P)/FAD-dependent oxidoreductase n=1 Tax=Dongia soli TaxID=600628 RepID=A0ABU5ECN2_9PROT|nr:NAD(P)/FAD-dependent oxidoreductase [Dongia soli]MDY0883804.1 NAD(P)/FAD-dependent oxidoreductase [Dongia soli]